MPNDVVFEYSDLLDEERVALLNGNFDALERLLDRKQRLTDEISKMNVAEWRDLVARARSNQKLLNAAMAGLRSASRRVNTPPRDDFKTYSAEGKLYQSSSMGRFEHKA